MRDDHHIERAVQALVSDHEAVYGALSVPIPVQEIAVDTVGLLVDETPDPRTKMRRGTEPPYVVSGLLLYAEQEVWLREADHLHRKRFSLAHELGHARLHCARVGADTDVFACGEKQIAETWETDDEAERQANAFAAELLLPTSLVMPRVTRVDIAMSVVLGLAQEFDVSPVCMAIRVARAAWQPYAMVVSSDGKVEFSFCSKEMKGFSHYSFVRKGAAVASGTETARFFREPHLIEGKCEDSRIVDPALWFSNYEGDLHVVEEVKGLAYGTVLTVLTRDYDEPQEEDDDRLEEDRAPWDFD